MVLNVPIALGLLLGAALLSHAVLSTAVSTSQEYLSDVEETYLPVNIKDVIKEQHGYEYFRDRSPAETPRLIVILTGTKTGKPESSANTAMIDCLENIQGCDLKAEELDERMSNYPQAQLPGSLNNLGMKYTGTNAGVQEDRIKHRPNFKFLWNCGPSSGGSCYDSDYSGRRWRSNSGGSHNVSSSHKGDKKKILMGNCNFIIHCG